MQHFRSFRWLSIFLGGFLLFSLGCSDSHKPKVIKLAHGLDVSHPVHLGMEFMAKQLELESGGELTIQIYPNQQLGSERETLELLQIGSVGMTKVSAAVLEGFAPELRIFGIPYIFQDREHFYEALDSPIGDSLLLSGEKFWLRGLTYFDAGARSFYTKDVPIHKPSDLNGLKIRVQESNTAIQMVKSLGGAGTPISWGELYTALQQGVVDGAENNPPSLLISRHYEVCKYYTLNEHTFVPDLLIISTTVWDKLSDQEKVWVQTAADKAAVYQRALWIEAEKEALEAVEKAGVTIIYPDKTAFAEKVKPMYELYKEDEKLYDLIAFFRAGWDK